MKNNENLNAVISRIWDDNCKIRALDIESGTDLSYRKVILPYVICIIEKYISKDDDILDIGCGCGFLSDVLYKSGFENIKGIDISKESILYCKSKYPYIQFFNMNVYDIKIVDKYRCCISVMTINNLPDIEKYLCIMYSLLKYDGYVIITIPHPCFWTQKHFDDTFQYNKEGKYDLHFKTKGRNDYSQILYFHRPIEMYFNAIIKTGFKIVSVSELKENDKENPDILGILIKK